jgi:hypothetical protein
MRFAISNLGLMPYDLSESECVEGITLNYYSVVI